MLVTSGHPCNFVIALFLLSANLARAAEPIGQKAMVSGTPTANLRAGAGVEHGLKLTLKEGDPVTIEKLEGEWYLVAAADGQKGYIHKNLLKPVAIVAVPAPVQAAATPQPQKADAAAPAQPAQSVGPAETATPPAVKSEKLPPVPQPVAPAEAVRPKPPEAQGPSLLQILEAHEAEVKIGLLVAVVAFALGWICGGLFAVRRERKHRRRLRL